jgi:hypothetical protein
MAYIALEEENFIWEDEEIEEFDRLWKNGADIWFLCKHFNRTQTQVAILIMDRHLKGAIKKRKYGLKGGSY